MIARGKRRQYQRRRGRGVLDRQGGDYGSLGGGWYKPQEAEDK